MLVLALQFSRDGRGRVPGGTLCTSLDQSPEASGQGVRELDAGAVDLRATATLLTCRTARGWHGHPRASGREARKRRGCVAAPSKRNSDAPAGLGVRWCRQLPDPGAFASRGAAGVGLLRDCRI